MLRNSLMSSPHISPYLPIDLGEVADVAQLAEGRRHVLAAGDVRLQASSRTEQTQQRVRLVTYASSSSSSSSSSSKGWGGRVRQGGLVVVVDQRLAEVERLPQPAKLVRDEPTRCTDGVVKGCPSCSQPESRHTRSGCLGARVLSSVGGASSRCAASRCSAIRSSATAHA